MIELRALGIAEIETGVTTLTPSQEKVFAAALYLVLERGKRVSRARLASLLWPRVAEKPRAHRLRQTILQLKKLGIVVTADRDNLQLSKHDARSDIDALSANDPLVPGGLESLEFLPGYSPRGSEPFRDWVDVKRDEVHAKVTKILVQNLGKARLKGDWAAVEGISSRILLLDSLNETAILAEAEAAAMRGSKSKAVAILDRYIGEVGGSQSELRLPATLLRRRVVERIPDGPALINADPPFVGREAEMEDLIRRFASAQAGMGSATLVIGEPGIGKSRLSAEFARFAELQGARVQRTTCRRHDLDCPLSLFVEIVPPLRELPGALGCAPETFTSLKRLTESGQRRGNDSQSADSEMLFQDLRASLFDLFDSVAEERCLVILVEDVQWLDDASAKILAGMAQWATTKRLFFLLNSRPTNNFLFGDPDTGDLHTIALSPLTPPASIALLRAMTRPDEDPQSGFVDWCLAVAEGNPYFLQELTHHWLETGRTYEAPPSVANVLHERLSRLSREALQVLQTCAVLADNATLDRVEKVLEYQPYQLLSAVEELSKAAMLRSHRGQTNARVEQLQPRHDFLSSAAVSRLAPVSLGFIHRRSADVLEKEFPQETMPPALLWASANHRHHAGDWGKALALSISCAEHLLEVGLAGDATTAFQKSLDYCATDAERLQVFPRLAFASQLNGEWERTREALRSCIRLTAKVNPSATRHNEFELLLFAARYRSALDFASLLADVVPCVSCPEASPAHRVSAAIIALKVAADTGPAEVIDSIYADVKLLLDDAEVSEASRFEVEMIYRTTRGGEVLALEDLQKFAESARATGGELAYSQALVTAAVACRVTARYEDGLAFIAQAFEHAITRKRQGRLSRLLGGELQLHLAAGAYDEAESTLRRLTECPIKPGDDFAQSELQTYRATIALAKSDFLGASAAIAGVEIVPRTYSARRRANSLAIRLHIRLNEGASHAEIESLVSELRDEHLKVRALGGHDFEAHALYIGLCSTGDVTEALTLLTEYVQVHRRSKWPLPAEIRTAITPRRNREPATSAQSKRLERQFL